MRTNIENLDWNAGNLIHSRDKDGRKTVDDVFDESTLKNIQQLFHRGVISNLENIIATGKEANLFRAKTLDGRNRAVKIYRQNTATFRKLEKYISGDPRFKSVGNNPRERVFTWAQKEYKNLHSMRASGAKVPEPFHVHKNIVVMQYMGWRFRPYPTIKELTPEEPETFLGLILDSIKAYRSAGISHGDLSEYNILNIREKPCIIDVGQAVPKEHPLYDELHKRDMNNMHKYWKKYIRELKLEDLK
tara:strand:+ start:147 stop:884 length:738 start_codon:yes stop_codon:yes gene_type:complete